MTGGPSPRGKFWRRCSRAILTTGWMICGRPDQIAGMTRRKGEITSAQVDRDYPFLRNGRLACFDSDFWGREPFSTWRDLLVYRRTATGDDTNRNYCL